MTSFRPRRADVPASPPETAPADAEGGTRAESAPATAAGPPSLVQNLPHLERQLLGLYATLDFRSRRRCQVIQVLGVVPEDGASSVCLGLAQLAARAGRKVLLVEADRPGSDRDRLAGGGDILPAEGQLTITPIWEGDGDMDPTVLRLSLALRRRDWFDLVLVDCNHAAFRPEGPLIATLCDGTVLALNAENQSEDIAAAAADRLRRNGATLLGVVLSQGL